MHGEWKIGLKVEILSRVLHASVNQDLDLVEPQVAKETHYLPGVKKELHKLNIHWGASGMRVYNLKIWVIFCFLWNTLSKVSL